MGRPVIDVTGHRFGRWLVMSRDHDRPLGQIYWWCRCDCGTVRSVNSNQLRHGGSLSCGCLARELSSERNSIHGMHNSPEYKSWQAMKDRCYRKTHSHYRLYGGRGITVCDRWRDSFEAFLEDVGFRPSPKHTLDRIDTNGDYEPDNCRWASRRQQANNRRDTRHITIDGETFSIAQWSRRFGINENTIRSRLRYGWPPERLLEPPTDKFRPKHHR